MINFKDDVMNTNVRVVTKTINKKNKFILLLRKGVYLYEYIND